MASKIQVEMIHQWKDTVYRLAFSRMRNASDAEDIAQEVFLRYLKANPSFESHEHAKAWFLRVTINRCNSFFRMAFYRHERPMEKDLSVSDPSVICHMDIHMAMEKLSKKYRTVIHLYYFENLTTEEISTILNIKESSVRMQLTRARRQLKEILGGDYEF